ncbi:hypothetical protein EPUS_06557 [Endocarpon pusillum Z07020]|uniref:Zinc finger PHD-type domain-containing protein n=1 Tax=Endocarpon pusillum (strain Z07020 / HMAS-L-300199) TaxID=1263415 RepID=U1GMH2_ENDPU|nr:uncharacterized protein EPUS_06557 [Endocarpon pusillum Z07020]ERF73096.1 hypothetical protein EPUS_06557 [Endocarpon pusillum Z07020]
MSPRRSSRARTTQPPPPPAHTNSSTSLSSLTRAERNTRANNKPTSPQDSATQSSESIEDAERLGRGEPPATRRSKRSNTNEKEEVTKKAQQPDVDEEAESEEVTRCICGNAEYPGPPPFARDGGRPHSAKAGIKEETAPKIPAGSDGLLDDTGNFFIQCDNCQVWQHGGCVGLLDESMSPDEYFCEECKPEYHKIHRISTGPRSSQYLPVLEASSPEPSSSSSNRDKTRRRDGKSRQSASSVSGKRRATMNSRDAAYDEDEMLRRAIEESRETGSLGKRTRDDSEDGKPNSKRRRTSSDSLPPSKVTPSPSQVNSEEDSSKPTANGSNVVKRARGAAARNPRDKEHRDRQKDLAAQRAEAASKRNARSERRRGDESPPPTPTLSPSKTAGQVPNGPQKSSAPDTPSHRANQPTNHRKTGRPPARRGRLGRNQYTRDQPLNGGGGGAETPLRDTSRGPTRRSSPVTAMNGFSNGINGESGRSSRPKYHHPNRTSMNEMKRRVAAILEFVNKMNGEKSSQNNSHGSSTGPSGSRTPNGITQSSGSGAHGNVQPTALLKGVEASLSAAQVLGEKAEREFRDMASGEMMHVLTRELVGWQSMYGKYGEK